METIVPTIKGQKQERSLCQRVDAKFGKLKVSEITASLLSEYRDTRIAEVSPQTVKHEISCVRRVLRIAQAEWGIWLPQGIPAVRMPKLLPVASAGSVIRRRADCWMLYQIRQRGGLFCLRHSHETL